MQRGISTHLFLPQRLTPALLDTLKNAGAQAIEVFAARYHFDYTDRSGVREIAQWFRSNEVAASMHMPLFTEAEFSRHTAPNINLIDAHKASRIAAMDEVKRALEAAEQIPFRSCVLHLGMKDDVWDTRALDDSLTAIEHLKAFAGPLGVRLLLENLANAVATPEHLVEIVRVGHFSTVGFCLDTGHANLAEPSEEAKSAGAKSGLAEAFDAFGDRLAELHLHDNHGPFGGRGDEHLWPLEKREEATVEWKLVAERVAALKTPPVGVLEISYELGYDAAAVSSSAGRGWKLAGA